MPDALLRRWAGETWTSLAAMTDERTGLPADSVRDDLDPSSRSGYTSPTNIGGLLWSTVAARDVGVIDAGECRDRCARTLATVERLEHHPDAGTIANWVDEGTGEVLREDPDGGRRIVPFHSSVDNGWLAAGLLVVAAAVPELAAQAGALRGRMDLGAFHDPSAGPPGPGGRLRGGFWESDPGEPTVVASYLDGAAPVHHTPHHYDHLDSEPRIASYAGIAGGDIPAEHYAAMSATVLRWRGRDVVPTWGGSMFEALMPDLFVPEEEWAPGFWGRSHPATVASHREHAAEQGWTVWGFSPCARPVEGYSVFGVPGIALAPEGYPSTTEDGDPVATPHAAALALLHEPEEAAACLARFEDIGCHGAGGFVDSVGLRSGRTAGRYLSLDQSMVMAALAHALDASPRRWFATPEASAVLEPVVAARPWPGEAPGDGAGR
ncbi:glucoamylase family protein [Phycicoccus sonneratiae]|uniref:DUF3131 domain-containing protein n=1 Tax=Phycicoccus sonneratiae TaxID=2807628 RepID=A0ABS2CMR2_9MICO|nr:glucoamylase family protein [Phycicoccus sonneraticus]MBM6401163.1 DUF3131 domain-containing protein [Phycicoccus sonneraticus]